VPTTRYGTEQNVPKNLLPADWFAVSPEKAHAPLIVMLVLTQLAAGALAADRWLVGTAALTAGSARLALVLGLAALGASFLHLGRPLRAWRVLVGLRTSWLSREILGFSLFAALAFLHAIKPSVWLGSAAAAVGLLSVFASVMVYAVTRRAFWQLPWSLVRFFGTTAVLGCATVLLVAAIGGNQDVARLAATAFAMSGLVKLSCELSLFRHLADRLHSPWKRSAILMRGDLGNVSLFRFFTGGAAVTIVALVLFAGGSFAPVLAGLIFLAALAGELAERYLFFAASTAPRMPGGVAS
jgi:DMSO reductase anchor subunit